MENENIITQQEVIAEPAAPQSERKYLSLGLWLVGIGLTWIFWNMRLLDWAWFERYGLIIFGGLLTARTVYTKKFRFFPGLTMTLIGCLHLYLDYQDSFGMRNLWPVYFLAAGATFFVNFVFKTSRWMSLVLSLFLIGFGAIQISRNLFYFPYEWAVIVRTYWPLTFVLAGIILVVTAIVKQQRQRKID